MNGLQFRLKSTSETAQRILADAVSTLSLDTANNIKNAQNWRSNYPIYYQKIVELANTNPRLYNVAEHGLNSAYQQFVFLRNGQTFSLNDAIPIFSPLLTFTLQGKKKHTLEWYIPYKGQKLQGNALLEQLRVWETKGILEKSHADALRTFQKHPEWLDLSQDFFVLLGAGSEAGPFEWLSKWKANIIAINRQNPKTWKKILQKIEQGNARLFAPYQNELGADLLTQTPEIMAWLKQFNQHLNIAALAYLDGEKHVRVAMAMDWIMQQNPKNSLMFMGTPTDVFAIPTRHKFKEKYHWQLLSKLSFNQIFKKPKPIYFTSETHQTYEIVNCLVPQQGPNYALAKRLQQWRALVSYNKNQQVSFRIAPPTKTYSVVKNKMLKAAYHGANLLGIEPFESDTTNAMMAALWIHDLKNPHQKKHPLLNLITEGAHHGGIWNVPYTMQSTLPIATLYGYAKNLLK